MFIDGKYRPDSTCADLGLTLTPQSDGTVLLEAKGPARLDFDGCEALYRELVAAGNKARELQSAKNSQ